MSESQVDMWHRCCADAKVLLGACEPHVDSLLNDMDNTSTDCGSDSDSDSDSDDANDIGDIRLPLTMSRRQLAREARAAQIYLEWQDNLGRTGRGSRAAINNDEEVQAVTDELKKRAGQMCMPMLLRSQAQRNKLRYPDACARTRRGGTLATTQSEPTPSGGMERRQAVRSEANRFDEMYAGVQQVMTGRLSFRVPVRSNTADVGEVARAV